jgi:hypothetical protein
MLQINKVKFMSKINKKEAAREMIQMLPLNLKENLQELEFKIPMP